MKARIIDRGRGPEIEGTRVTVYRVMDFLREGDSSERIAAELHLTTEQVQAALAYLADHRLEVEQGYEEVLQRVKQNSPSWIEAENARTAEELRQRIRTQRSPERDHAGHGR